tara:strand:+ start:1073 stop:1465 length:393 start_codon:yes stop_codon:yes gene_type:complete
MAKKAVKRKPRAKTEEAVSADVGTAVIDVPEEPKAWRMPQPDRGECVTIYPRGTVSKRNAGVAFVIHTGERSIDCVYMNNAYGEVIHRDDPRIKAGAEILDEIGGIWEFKDDRLSRKISELEERIEQLEG